MGTTTTFVHRLTGRTFIAEAGEGYYGPTSRDGRWDSGEAGTIWPDEPLLASTAWVEA